MFRKTVLCLLPLVLLCTTQTATSDEQADPFARDLKILTDWFEGEFDNEEQLWFENDPRSNTPEEERHIRLHTVHTRLDLPTFGEHVRNTRKTIRKILSVSVLSPLNRILKPM